MCVELVGCRVASSLGVRSFWGLQVYACDPGRRACAVAAGFKVPISALSHAVIFEPEAEPGQQQGRAGHTFTALAATMIRRWLVLVFIAAGLSLANGQRGPKRAPADSDPEADSKIGWRLCDWARLCKAIGQTTGHKLLSGLEWPEDGSAALRCPLGCLSLSSLGLVADGTVHLLDQPLAWLANTTAACAGHGNCV